MCIYRSSCVNYINCSIFYHFHARMCISRQWYINWTWLQCWGCNFHACVSVSDIMSNIIMSLTDTHACKLHPQHNKGVVRLCACLRAPSWAIRWPHSCMLLCRGLAPVTSKLCSKPLKVTKRSEETWCEFCSCVFGNISLMLTIICITCYSGISCCAWLLLAQLYIII